jgi:SAM-dependent methyltransferase
MKCRHCGNELALRFVDLGSAPPSNAYLTADTLDAPERYYPLVVMVCDRCWLVQTKDFAEADELFASDYAYFSAFSSSWLLHSERYVDEMIRRFELGRGSHVVEVASNDGYLLQYVRARGIPCLGIEPTASTAAAARRRGVETIEEFFGVSLGARLAAEGRGADLMAANNVLAHVPDINDFLGGFAKLLKAHGVATFEFPHLLKLVTENQFDTIYHEHFSYFSLITIEIMAARHGLRIIDVEELPTHGGSLRVYLAHAASTRPVGPAVAELLAREESLGLRRIETYAGFTDRVHATKRNVLAVLIELKNAGKTICGYGAPGKGNTLLNYCGIGTDFLDFTVDRNPYKHGRFTPGMRIPILPVEAIEAARPDYIFILPWNLKTEILRQMRHVETWGAKFIVPIPDVAIIDPKDVSL